MGEVYLAEDTKPERQVAIKLLPAEFAQDNRRRRRFLTEAKAAAALNHPNICTVFDVGETENHSPFIAMEVLVGETLNVRLRRGPLPIPEALRIGTQVADALAAAHHRGIVHRDIKPSNLSVDERGHVKVLDFGLAKRQAVGGIDTGASSRLVTQTGEVMGTPCYMSPEQALGREADHRTDLFSLGVVLYEILTGRRPFGGSSFTETVDNILHQPSPPLGLEPSTITRELERIICQCMEKDAEKRYQSACQLSEDLRNVASMPDAVTRDDQVADPLRTRSVVQEEWQPVLSEGERRPLTGVWCRTKSRASSGALGDMEELQTLITDFQSECKGIVELYEGQVLNRLGDRLLIGFGHPKAHENDAERALLSAWEIRKRLSNYNEEKKSDLEIHVGVNTGLAILARAPAADELQASLMGQAFDVAARLQEVSGPGDILVGEETLALTERSFDFEPHAAADAPGSVPAPSAFRLVRPKSPLSLADQTRGFDSPLVGREDELRRFRSVINRLSEGMGTITTIVGEAGVGKSRLLKEFERDWRDLSASRPPSGLPQDSIWVEGRCLSHGKCLAYHLWADVLRGLLRVDEASEPARAVARLRECLTEACPDDAEHLFPLLGRLLGCPETKPQHGTSGQVNAQRLRGATVKALLTFLEATARQRPLILVCEDLHWADPTSLECMEQVLALPERVPLALVCTLRPETDQACWRIREIAARDYRHLHLDLALNPLSAEESEKLLSQLVPAEALSPQSKRRLLSHAEGNPFYLEELARALDLRHSRRADSQDVAKAAKLPDSLRGVLLSRIDRLDREAKGLLQIGAVLGRTFSYSVLKAIAPARLGLEQNLLRLQREQMIRERRRVPEREFIFQHHLTQEAAYDSLLKKQRKELHRRVGEALELLWPEPDLDQTCLLARHWEGAEAADKAVTYLRRAGDRARAVYANEEAIDFYRRALRLLEPRVDSAPESSPSEGARLQESLGQVLDVTGKHKQALQAFERSLELLPKTDYLSRARLYRRRSWSLHGAYEPAAATAGLVRAEETLGSTDQSRPDAWWHEWIEIQIARMWIHYWQAEWEPIAELRERVAPQVDRHGTAHQRIGFLTAVPLSDLRRSRYEVNDLVLQSVQAAVEIAENSVDRDPSEMGTTRFMRGFARLWRRDYDGAQTDLELALRHAERTGDAVLQARCLTYLSVLHRRLGQVDKTEEYAEKALAVASGGRMPEYIAAARANHAWVAWRRGQLAAAEQQAEATLQMWQTGAVIYPFQWLALWPLIALANRGHNLAKAAEWIDKLTSRDQQALGAELERALKKVSRDYREGEPERATEELERTLQLASRKGCL